MPHDLAARQRLIAEWRRAYASACSTAEAPGSQSAWMARLKLRLYRFLLSLYGDGGWTESKSTGVSDPAVPADLESVELAGKPAKSLDAIQKALKSVSGGCTATPSRGPLIAGCGSEAWTVIASSSGGIDAKKCGDFLKRQGIMARIVHGDSESTVAVRSLHESVACCLVATNHAQLALPRATAKPRERPKFPLPANNTSYRSLVWILLAVPFFVFSGYYNFITFHPEFAASVPPGAVIGFFAVLAGILLLPVFLRLIILLDRHGH